MPHTHNKTGSDRHTAPTLSEVLGIISLMLIVLFIFIFISRAHARKQAQYRQLTRMQIEQQAYRAILTEMNTGMRLARWEDFLQQFPNGQYDRAVRVQHTVLQTHEMYAWAKYSDAVYTVRTNPQKKLAAYERYIANWGTLIRTQQLETLSTGTDNISTKSLSFKTEKSIYQGGKNAGSLAGEPHKTTISPQQAPRISIKKPLQKNRLANRDIRVKTARRPIYPRKAKRRGINAKVILSLNIDTKGRVTHVKLVSVEAKRYRGEFVRAARRAARRARFYPKIRGNKPVKHNNYLRTYTFAAQK